MSSFKRTEWCSICCASIILRKIFKITSQCREIMLLFQYTVLSVLYANVGIFTNVSANVQTAQKVALISCLETNNFTQGFHMD